MREGLNEGHMIGLVMKCKWMRGPLEGIGDLAKKSARIDSLLSLPFSFCSCDFFPCAMMEGRTDFPCAIIGAYRLHLKVSIRPTDCRVWK